MNVSPNSIEVRESGLIAAVELMPGKVVIFSIDGDKKGSDSLGDVGFAMSYEQALGLAASIITQLMGSDRYKVKVPQLAE
ncbi:hypothetical protein [Polynucleobacter yangtzensis]|uniref:Uncharacterized protein n=1 Tax=Polynucleobacter yangtzensis TaxID=1743159 RepID=A0ABM8CMU9_9BURK|nr:hypothetical protein [Polynucleobacter yangtzensis]BDT79232.1 hypothetical protein PKF032_11200 [Polynucleobacter yangtzensis]